MVYYDRFNNEYLFKKPEKYEEERYLEILQKIKEKKAREKNK